jgi:oxygen-independent coproporphyrinogen-3 oxidase
MQALVQKYSGNIPRYTSFPTVLDWKNNINYSEWIHKITPYLIHESVSLYLHIPFCTKLCTFCACNKIVTENYENVHRYIFAIEQEILEYKKHINFGKITVKQFHIGGGTPTFLRPQEMEMLFQMLEKYFEFEKSAEKSIEAHPEFTTKEQISTLKKWGFNRISFGIQDFNPQVQEIINRKQSYKNILELTHFARENDFNSINYDFIYGLPLQNSHCIDQIIDSVREAKPDRIAFYGYAHVPWKSALQRKYSSNDLPNPQERLGLFMQGKQGFEALGYHSIGMDHFALPTDDLYISYHNSTLHRNFMGYTIKHTNALLGLGVSSISEIPNAYKQNTKNLTKFYNDHTLIETSHLLLKEEVVAKKQIMQLMTQFFTECVTLTPPLKEMQQDGLLEHRDGQIYATKLGKAFLRNIAVEFDINRKSGESGKFSQSV